MADSVTLSAAVRSSLLSLQSTTNLIDRTQGRLSSGLKVAGPVDDPVAFFQAKALNDRASDFTERKDSIDQGVSTVSAALDGVNSVETLVRQLKGVANSMKSASTAQFADLITQFNDLRTQVNNLAADASYQGTNLINGTGSTLTVEFSDLTAAVLNVDSVDVTVGTNGLGVGAAAAYTAGAVYVSYEAGTASYNVVAASGTNAIAGGFTQTGTLALTWEGGNQSYTAGATISVTYGTQSLTVNVNEAATLNAGDVISVNVDSAAATSGYSVVGNSYLDAGVVYSASTAGNFYASSSITLTWAGADATVDSGTTYTVNYGTGALSIQFSSAGAGTAGASLTAGEVFTVEVLSAGSTTGAGAYALAASTAIVRDATGLTATTASVGLTSTGTVNANEVTTRYVSSGDTTAINRAISQLDTALATLRSQASTLGSNVATLQTRLTFTENYVNTLGEGSSKLTLADLNQEGANLLALQTRQQLGIQALAFAGQAEQSILGLFR